MPEHAATPTKPGRIGRHSLLSHDEVVRLARAYRKGLEAAEALDQPGLTSDEASRLRRERDEGLRARDEIVTHNLRLVASMAKRFSVDGLTFDDHFQNGCRGLLRAVEKFDPDAGFRFSTYATWWIRQSITRGIDNSARLIRVPVHVMNDLRRLDRAMGHLMGRSGRAPLNELVAATGFSEDKIQSLLRLLGGVASLDATVGDGLTTLGEFIPATTDNAAERAEIRDLIRQSLLQLTHREREIVVLRFGLDGSEAKTLEEIGKVFGLTRERIRQIEAEALRKLRPPLAESLGRDPRPISSPAGSEGSQPIEVAPPGNADADMFSPTKLKALQQGLAPRGRRFLDELSLRPGGVAPSELLEAIGLPASAPLPGLAGAVNAALSEVDLPRVDQCDDLLRLDPHLAAGWRGFRHLD